MATFNALSSGSITFGPCASQFNCSGHCNHTYKLSGSTISAGGGLTFESGSKPMHGRGLYEVFIVDAFQNKVVHYERIVADSEEKAKYRVICNLPPHNDIDVCDVITRFIGPVQRIID